MRALQSAEYFSRPLKLARALLTLICSRIVDAPHELIIHVCRKLGELLLAQSRKLFASICARPALACRVKERTEGPPTCVSKEIPNANVDSDDGGWHRCASARADTCGWGYRS